MDTKAVWEIFLAKNGLILKELDKLEFILFSSPCCIRPFKAKNLGDKFKSDYLMNKKRKQFVPQTASINYFPVKSNSISKILPCKEFI